MSASQPTHTSSGPSLFAPGPLGTPSPRAASSVSASQPTHTSSGPSLFAPGPLGTPSPMVGSTTNKSTGTMGNSFGNPNGSQPVIGGTQGPFPEPRTGLFSSNYGPGPGSSSGTLLQGGATSSPFGSSAFGSTTAPNIGSASSGSLNKPPSQGIPLFPSPSGNSQSKAESTVSFGQLSNSSRR